MKQRTYSQEMHFRVDERDIRTDQAFDTCQPGDFLHTVEVEEKQKIYSGMKLSCSLGLLGATG